MNSLKYYLLRWFCAVTCFLIMVFIPTANFMHIPWLSSWKVILPASVAYLVIDLPFKRVPFWLFVPLFVALSIFLWQTLMIFLSPNAQFTPETYSYLMFFAFMSWYTMKWKFFGGMILMTLGIWWTGRRFRTSSVSVVSN